MCGYLTFWRKQIYLLLDNWSEFSDTSIYNGSLPLICSNNQFLAVISITHYKLNQGTIWLF